MRNISALFSSVALSLSSFDIRVMLAWLNELGNANQIHLADDVIHSSISLLIYLLVLLITERGVLKPPNIVVVLIVSHLSCMYQFLLHVFWGNVIKCAYTFKIVVFLTLLIMWCLFISGCFLCSDVYYLFSLKRNINVAAPAFFWLVFAWYIYFHTFIFNLLITLYLKEISFSI